MSGVQFQLGHNDHRVVQDFLERGPDGVGAIMLPAKQARLGSEAAAAAAALGIGVLFDPMTERLVAPGYSVTGLGYHSDDPYDVDLLSRDPAARTQLLQGVLEAHPNFVTAVTPPHFYVSDERSADLNLSLVSDVRTMTELLVRPIVTVSASYAFRHAVQLADEYSKLGVSQVELRLSPLGGENVGLRKFRHVMSVLDAFRAAGIITTLGWSGNVGQVAVAMGHADSYSVGVTDHEKVDWSATVSRQRRDHQDRIDGVEKQGHPGRARVYLPGIAMTVAHTTAERLLGHTDIRLRLGCRRGECAETINGPLQDARRHYLHARAGEMADLLAQPAVSWRTHAVRQRLQQALALRRRINNSYNTGEAPLATRTLESILDSMVTGGAAQSA
jgi:hypothetical protein